MKSMGRRASAGDDGKNNHLVWDLTAGSVVFANELMLAIKLLTNYS